MVVNRGTYCQRKHSVLHKTHDWVLPRNPTSDVRRTIACSVKGKHDDYRCTAQPKRPRQCEQAQVHTQQPEVQMLLYNELEQRVRLCTIMSCERAGHCMILHIQPWAYS